MLKFDTEGTDFPVCPYCGEIDQDWHSRLIDFKNDGDTWPSCCISCGGNYDVILCVTLSFNTKEENNE